MQRELPRPCEGNERWQPCGRNLGAIFCRAKKKGDMPVSDQALRAASDPTVGSMMMMEYDANKKSAGIAYLLWFFVGMLGAHRFYLAAPGTGAAILILTLVATFLSFVLVGFVLLLIPSIWVLVDAFLIPGMVRNYNNELITQLRQCAPDPRADALRPPRRGSSRHRASSPAAGPAAAIRRAAGRDASCRGCPISQGRRPAIGGCRRIAAASRVR